MLSWQDLQEVKFDSLIIGNGASIAVSPRFSYRELFHTVMELQLVGSDLKNVFEYLQTRDFELVLNRLWHSHHINIALGIEEEKTDNAYKQIRNALINAVRENHADFADVEAKLERMAGFLKPFKKVISLNYDLVIYWAIMRGNAMLHGNWFKDCFYNGNFLDDWERLQQPHGTLAGSTLVFYPHGNLLLATDIAGSESKLSISSIAEEKLLEKILESWEQGEKVPLFVSEGHSDQKLKAIKRSSYLSKVYDQVLVDLGPTVMTLGWSLSEQDQHIIWRIAKSDTLQKIYIGIYGDGHSAADNQDEFLRVKALIGRVNSSVEVECFDSSSPGCWINE
jgi:hypothetical protein